MGEEGHIEEILNLSNDHVATNCPVFQAAFHSENYEDLLCPFGTPPGKYACVDALPSAMNENQARQDVSDPLGFPEGSPVTPQLHESSIILSEMDFDDHEHSSPYGSRLLNESHEKEKQGLEGDLTENAQAKIAKERRVQFRPGMDNDLQELLELGKAMSLPSRPEINSATFQLDESNHRKQQETCGNFSPLPFPLEQVITTLEKGEASDEQNFSKQSVPFSSSDRIQIYPESSTVHTNAQVGVIHDALVSKQSEDVMRVSIDDILQEVASRNLRRCQQLEHSRATEDNDNTMQPARKKRKTGSSSTEIQKGTEDTIKENRSTAQRKRSSKKRLGCSRTDAETSGKAYSSSGSTPSRFCHICTRAAKPDVVLVCGNVARGTCRKVICFKCIRDMSWDWGSLHGTEAWTCTHCREDCPAKAQCHTYRRVNQNRRADGRRSRKISNGLNSAKLVQNNDDNINT